MTNKVNIPTPDSDGQPVRRVEIILAVLPSDVPVGVRLRRLLKVALRAFHLRCESIGPAKPADGPTGGADASGGNCGDPEAMR
jgi:hypothetical protein